MKKNLDNPVVKRALIAFGFEHISDIAKLFSKSSQNINGMIRRETFINLIEPECFRRKINVEWIKTGEGDMNIVKIADIQLPWEIKKVIEGMQKLIDHLSKDIEKHEKKNQDIWGAVNDLRKDMSRINAAQMKLGEEIGDVKNRMIDAAQSGEIHRLGAIGDKGK
jgi:predicted nuclease with TOPRIM domain